MNLVSFEGDFRLIPVFNYVELLLSLTERLKEIKLILNRSLWDQRTACNIQKRVSGVCIVENSVGDVGQITWRAHALKMR